MRAALLLALSCAGAPALALGPADAAPLLDDLLACTGGGDPVALAVAGLPPDQTALSDG